MREEYSTLLATAAGFLVILGTFFIALNQSPEMFHGPERLSPPIPHELQKHEDCDRCHGLKGEVPYPIRHLGWSVEICVKCHSVRAGN